MPYSDLTTRDPNPIKRFLQNSRFQTALNLYPRCDRALNVVDFGGGDGELCLRLAEIDPQSRYWCYEPVPSMREEAKMRLQHKQNVSILSSLESVEPASSDVVFSLEVFEHLPEVRVDEALDTIFSLLAPGGTLVLGVPNELYLAALYKGLFRSFRRFGDYDTQYLNILKCAVGKPPQERPVGELAPGWQYHFHHLGFDHRRLRGKLAARTSAVSVSYSPYGFLGAIASPEIYLTCVKGMD